MITDKGHCPFCADPDEGGLIDEAQKALTVYLRGQQALALLEDFFKGMGPVYRDKWRIKVKALLKREGKT